MIHHLLERRLADTAQTRKWQSVIRRTTIIASIWLTVILALGVLVLLGWLRSSVQFTLLATSSFLLSCLVWLISVIMIVDRRLDRKSLAASVEQEHEVLLDRFNTVLELDQRQGDSSAKMYRNAIEQQAAGMMSDLPPDGTLKWSALGKPVLIMCLLMLLTPCFYFYAAPLQRLAAITESDPVPEEVSQSLTIPEPPREEATEIDPTNQEVDAWGEIRISEPGRDLRITRHEDVPLLIEAASDRPLEKITWQTKVNEEEEVTRGLPKLEDPRYAVFQPVLQPDELGLAEWDLACYHAVANAQDQTRYKSSTYFVEVIPGSDALEELPDVGYEKLEELTALIHRQQQVIRSTEKLTDPTDDKQGERMDGLADQETSLAASAQAVREELSERLGPNVTKEFSRSIESAGTGLHSAESALLDRTTGQARVWEESALMRLVDARRELADLIENHPDAFQPRALENLNDRPDLSAHQADPELAELLKQLARETDETRQASDDLKELLGQQRDVEKATQGADQQPLSDSVASELATRQSDIRNQFEAVRDQHSDVFRDLQGLSNEVTNSMQRATEQLSDNSDLASSSVQQAESKLEQVVNELEQRTAAHEMFQSDSLQQRLMANREAYRKIEKAPQEASDAHLQEVTEETQSLLEQLPENINGDSNASEKTASAPENQTPKNANDSDQATASKTPAGTKQQINQQCDSLRQSTENGERSELAGNIGQSLDQISDSLAQESERMQNSFDQQKMASQMKQMLQQAADLRDARQFVQEALQRERAIQSKALEDVTGKQKFQALAEEQLTLEEEMKQAMEENRSSFQPVAGQCQNAQAAMRQATQSLSGEQNSAPKAAEEAVQALKDLDQSLANQQQGREAAERQRLAQMLDDLIEKLDEMEKNPDKVSDQEKQKTAGQCQSAGSMACKMAGSSSGSGQGGSGQGGSRQGGSRQGEKSSSSDQAGRDQAGREQALSDATEQLAQSQGSSETSDAAQGLKQQMQSLADGMGKRGRGAKPGAPLGDSLRPGGRAAINRGLAQLESAARRGQQGNLTPQAGNAMHRSGMSDILTGIQGEYGYNDGTQVLIERVEKEIREPTASVDIRTVNQLREQIQKLQRDMKMQTDAPTSAETTLQNDPVRFPAAYRESIQNYFQALSEDKQ